MDIDTLYESSENKRGINFSSLFLKSTLILFRVSSFICKSSFKNV